MSDTYRIKSRFLNVINECIKKLSIIEDSSSYTQPSIDEDGKFYTDVTTDVVPNFNNTEISKINDNKTEDQLLDQVINKLKQSVDIAADVEEIINQITGKKQNTEWVLNKDHCDLYLANKNAHIFKQNNNLCLSHNGKIEIFKSIEELKKYLSDHDFPDLPNVKLYESVK